MTLSLAAAGSYFYFVSAYAKSQKSNMLFTAIDVEIDNAVFIDEGEVKDIVKRRVIGKPIDSINIYNIENELSTSGSIKNSDVYYQMPGTLYIKVSQRIPVLRFITNNGGFYCDRSGFILPLVDGHSQDLPIVSGVMPFSIPEKKRGVVEEGREDIMNILSLSEYIRNNAYWDDEIEQIDINSKGKVTLICRSISEKIEFGKISNIEDKFEKLAIYFKTIRDSSNHYSIVNLEYKDQIVCRK